MDLYYITDKNQNQELVCYCKDGTWRLYVECEKDWNNLVFLAPCEEAYNKMRALVEKQNVYPEVYDNKSVLNNSYNRHVYVKLVWGFEEDDWVVSNKTLADSYQKAYQKLAADDDINAVHRILHYSEASAYEVEHKIDNITLSIIN